MIYYNENNKFAANWLEKLMQEQLIPQGIVDRRSITEIKPDDLKQYKQCHFFAGIGGWSYALELAKWEEDRPVWTGSCPCQPFSAAGNKKGFNDERDLWPVWFKLIKECKPTTVFGEQVEPAIKHGWLDRLSNDLEAEDYAIGAAVLPACSVGTPHQRKRLWWVANSNSDQCGSENRKSAAIEEREESCDREDFGELWDIGGASSAFSIMADADIERLQGVVFDGHKKGRVVPSISTRLRSRTGFWSDAQYIKCTDGKYRPIEPSIRLLVNGFPSRMGLLRGFGNAIVPQMAAVFIKSFMGISV
ncbi:hypothetical protein CIN_21470 [Commensalibacter intestini A911]|uniref:DNA (cytosine-5-)-methyltransferase n=1 Tax=Commensalibacter intestini A911 TaxID=1088868 RepID=G6F3F1_9PROT|nr:DNA cytosine methyltransferase [Commensalibacter intestini]EHD12901.1 hypothetical protein CIN_21470 [Commensalibacter intestini A911]